MHTLKPIIRSTTSILATSALMAGMLVGVQVGAAPTAEAADRISQQVGFNGRAWSVTSPDSQGIRYVGGDFTSYQAWNTGIGASVSATDGAVNAEFPRVSGWPHAKTVIPDGSGGWYISGGINNVDGSGVSRVAHINADGSLDTSWRPTVSGGQGVWAMAKYGDVILIGGDFSSVNGQARTRLAAIHTDGTLLNWAPTANSTVHTITVSGDTAYIGGQFSQISSISRGLAAAVRLDTRTSPATGTCLTDWDAMDCLSSWNPSVGGWGVLSIAVDSTFTYLAGAFSTIGGQSRNGAGKVNTSNAAVQPWNPGLNSQAEALAIHGGKVYIGGLFTEAGGTTRNKLAAFDVATDTLESWNPNVTGDGVKSMSVQGSTLYVGGKFSFVGGQGRNHAAAVDTSGNVLSWDPHVCDNTNGSQTNVFGLASTPTQVYMLGDFPCVGGLKRMHAAAVSRNGILTDWAPVVNGPVFSFSRTGSTIYMGGNFSTVNGESRGHAAAVDTSGVLTPWNPRLDGRPESIIATPTKIYVGGWFSNVDGTARRGLAVVDPTTAALDLSFNAGLDGAVREMTLSGSRLFIGGDFTSVGGETHSYVASVNAVTGSVNSAFTASTATGTKIWPFVEALAVIGDRLYIGGYFGQINGTVRNHVGAVDATTGALDTTWNPSASNWVFALTPSTDGSLLYVGGTSGMTITTGSGSAQGVAALDPATGALNAWRADTGEVRGISVSDAVVYLAGSFSSVGGLGRQNTAAVSTTGNVLDPWPMNPSTALTLDVAVTGTDTGAVVSDPGGINCGESCEYAYTPGSTVTLTAVPDPGASFSGWTGDCSGSATTCTVTLLSARSTTAIFGSTGAGDSGSGAGSQVGSPTSASSESDTSAPTAPLEVTAVAGNSQVRVSWKLPRNSGSSAITRYQVTGSPGSQRCTTSNLTCTVEGLTNGQAYEFRVQAFNGLGWSEPSAGVKATPSAELVNPAIVIVKESAKRRTAAGARVVVLGRATGIEPGTVLRARFKQGNNRLAWGKQRVLVRQDGTFRWSRWLPANTSLRVRIIGQDVTSNTLVWKVPKDR